LRNSALVLFEVTANYLFSKYRLQALIFKIPASAKLAVKYRPSGNPMWDTCIFLPYPLQRLPLTQV